MPLNRTPSTFLALLSSLRLRRAQALLYYLLADSDRVHRVEKVVDLFWQDSDGQRAAASYRQVVRHIRRATGDAGGVALDTGGGQIALRLAEPFSLSDYFLAGLSANPWDAAAAERIREIVGFTLRLQGISSSFDSWLAITRSTLLSVVRRALDRRLAVAGEDAAGETRLAAEFALELEPANEVAVRYLMSQDWQAGHATRAIERYNTLYAHLAEEFDQEPEAETIELLAAIKLDPVAPPRRQAATDRRPQISLAVALLPAQTGDRELASFHTVLFADLRMRMGRFREWRVIEAEGPERPKARITLRPVLAQGLHRLFVEVQRGEDGDLLWSEVIDQPEADWEAKVRVLLANIANALSIVVSDRSLTDFGAAIYDRWLKAQALLDAWSPETEGEALAMLREITEESPRFGPAHAELAGALNVRHVLLPGTRQTEDVKQDALHHAIIAVSTDPMDTRAHRVLGWCYCHKGEFGLAGFHFDQALNLNRSSPLTLASCALGFAFAGEEARTAELVAEARRHSAVVEPFHLIYLAAADYLLGDYESAAEQCGRGAGLMPTVGGWHSAALWQLGRRDEAARRLAAYLDEIRAEWCGPPAPCDGDILDWFTSIFPLRDEQIRLDLRATLEGIARAATPRRAG
ncbi:BTAD domain-containing putative transcriptional regulator [Paracoccus siganidrum]|uniref:SARP family transcriptional regulator n=1 Tax=Paracoccus siganidrum TaxID=1276757 RepID=A0A419AA82_9RHOB|nr:BTAD domain-containing putative transcriptional regulator [Paracoccus siganidrum]RJL19695.1 SARP family transcriptional regulator [Paracoccus siganidrum]RMC35922.1 SARP family transcriptional regulator [Paracoccus siganidrum]